MNKNIQGTGHEPENGRATVLQACRAMLQPIARMLIKSGIVHRDLTTLMREVYVDVARSEFGLRGRQTSISRTALLTGLARKEVRRIANAIEQSESAMPDAQDRISRVLTGWYRDEDYVDADGRPLRIAIDGPAPSFAELKSRYGGDVPASAMLRELITAGTVEKLGDATVRPRHRYFMPNPADPQHMLRAGSVIEDVGTTVIRNLYRTDPDDRWFERRVVYADMSAKTQKRFRDFLDVEGQALLDRVDAWLAEHETDESNGQPIRLGLGMYLISRDD